MTTATREQLKKALTLAVNMLAHYEPGDSRAVSNEFVALAAVQCDLVDDAVMKVIEDALENSARGTP